MKWLWRSLVALSVLLLVVLSSVAVPDTASAQGENEVILLTVDGPVTPAMGSYLARGLQQAEARGAQLLVLRLDTPGGSVQIMSQLVRQMTNANVPTLVYVWPSGGHAASAGTFITLSANLAAMAPRTTIGSAAVVGGGGEEIDETSALKVTNDLVAAIRSQTARRGEEAADWAERAITEAIAANATQALEIGIIDFIARDLEDLLAQADGAEVELATGQRVTLDLSTAIVREIEMTQIERFLHVITNPNIALLLISLGGLALFYELASPGTFGSGIFGIIATLLGFYSLGSLDANWAGLGLILFAFILFGVELTDASTGLFAFGGVAAFIFGALLLFQDSYIPVNPALVFSIALVVAGFFVFAIAAVRRVSRRTPITGQQGLIGRPGEVRRPVGPEEEGMVFVDGELWRAYASVALPRGARVRVVSVQGLHVEVAPLDAAAENLLTAEQPSRQG
jgi:membrane-bound serine protease (ClpP class)